MRVLDYLACLKSGAKLTRESAISCHFLKKIVFFNEIFATCAMLTLQIRLIGVLCSVSVMPRFRCYVRPGSPQGFARMGCLSRFHERVYFVHSPCMSCRFSLSFLRPLRPWRSALTWQSEKGRLSGRPSRPRVNNRYQNLYSYHLQVFRAPGRRILN